MYIYYTVHQYNLQLIQILFYSLSFDPILIRDPLPIDLFESDDVVIPHLLIAILRPAWS